MRRDEHSRDIGVAAAAARIERAHAAVDARLRAHHCYRVHGRARIEQQPHERHAALQRGLVQWCGPVRAPDRGVRAPLEQHHGHILVPVLNGHEQWRSAVREALIRAASRKQEEASDVGVAVLAGDIQKIGLRSSVAQILCHEPSEHRKVSALDSEREGRLGLALG